MIRKVSLNYGRKNVKKQVIAGGRNLDQSGEVQSWNPTNNSKLGT